VREIANGITMDAGEAFLFSSKGDSRPESGSNGSSTDIPLCSAINYLVQYISIFDQCANPIWLFSDL
jgi:hypothetical protein